MAGISETLKKKIDDLELERRLDELYDRGEQTLQQGLDRAGDLAHERREEVERLLDRAEVMVNQRTDGKYADTVTRVSEGLRDTVERLAGRRTAGAPDAVPDTGTTVHEHAAPAPEVVSEESSEVPRPQRWSDATDRP